MEISSDISVLQSMSSQGNPNIKNIILDVDETLVHTIEDRGFKLLNKSGIMSDPKLMKYRDRILIFRLEDVVGLKGEGLDTDMWSITRPHLEQFLNFCFTYFENVIIWSAGLDGYVREIVNRIFDPLKGMPQPSLIYTRKDCVKLNGITTKPIINIIEQNPELANTVTLENTIFIDDLYDNFINNPDNGVLIPAYSPNTTISSIARDDIALQQLMYWLLQKDIKNSTDIRTLPKNIFDKSINQLISGI